MPSPGCLMLTSGELMKRKKMKCTVQAGELVFLRRDVAGADLGSREHDVCALRALIGSEAP